MKRDMDLVRLILMEIEEKYRSTAIYNLTIDGYDIDTVALQPAVGVDLCPQIVDIFIRPFALVTFQQHPVTE